MVPFWWHMRVLLPAGLLLAAGANGVSSWAQAAVEVTGHLPVAAGRGSIPTAALWLTQLDGKGPADSKPLRGPGEKGPYTLLQKNKEFVPHLLIVPVGSTVRFPNGDPFFHNVFSLFNGRRFDLGLYEAGSSRDVTFPREGVSYIFCNIHSQMSAVVISLGTPYYAAGTPQGTFALHGIPAGTYVVHLWVEGQTEEMAGTARGILQISAAHNDVSALLAGAVLPAKAGAHPHLNKFGQPYESGEAPIY